MKLLTRIYAAAALVAAALVVGQGCATLQPPIAFESETPPADSSVRIRVLEGRPDGLLLELQLDDETTEAGTTLQLLRADGRSEAQVYREIELDAPLRDALSIDGVEFLDRNVSPGLVTRYQLKLLDRDGEALDYSTLVRVKWQQPPQRPEGLRGRVHTANTVELRWASPQNHGAVIFRRNVLQEGSTPRRVAQVAPDSAGVFVDDDVETGVVYAYRVSLAVPRGAFVQLGPPSEPVYVDVPGR